jgi:hypothetical protein
MLEKGQTERTNCSGTAFGGCKRELKKERHDGIAIHPPPIRLPRKEEIDEDSEGKSGVVPMVEFGFRGRWYSRTVFKDTTEEEMNVIASELFGKQMAATDFTVPHERQQSRCYRDISKDEPRIWVDLRMVTPKMEAMIRCSANSTAVEIEEVAAELWQMEVHLQKELPTVIPSNTMSCLSRPKAVQTEEAGES